MTFFWFNLLAISLNEISSVFHFWIFLIIFCSFSLLPTAHFHPIPERNLSFNRFTPGELACPGAATLSETEGRTVAVNHGSYLTSYAPRAGHGKPIYVVNFYLLNDDRYINSREGFEPEQNHYHRVDPLSPFHGPAGTNASMRVADNSTIELIKKPACAGFLGFSPGRTRTCDTVVNSHLLLPTELPGNFTYKKNKYACYYRL